jgi:TolA-binding protein
MLSRHKKYSAGRKDYELGKEYYLQQKYAKAELLYRRSKQEREEVLGAKHKDTLWSKYALAATLSKQQKYAEAEQLFRRLVQEREEVLGVEHKDTLESRYWLGTTLSKQQKYAEAEQLFRQLVQEREEVLGAKHEDTLESRYWLAATLSNQRKHAEAEQLFRQLVQEREEVLGAKHEDTLESRYWLAATLSDQQKHAEAEQLIRQSVQEREEVLGAEHKDTLKSKRLYDELLAITPVSINTTAETVASRLGAYFIEDRGSGAQYTDFEICQISLLLKQLNPEWSKVPRIYIILRTIGCLSLLDDFINHHFSDYWLPFAERSLPDCFHPSQRSKFVATQNLVMTKSMDLEKGAAGQHCHFHRNEAVPFEEKGIIGSGGFGQVDKVLSLISFREYARKLVIRSMMFGHRTGNIKGFIAEIEILKRLKHHHIVEFVGSYTDPKYMALLMSPVAEMDLSMYLDSADTSRNTELRTFFGCLARALEFLHEQKVRHKDIKPRNILVHSGKVLFTDFGLSLDFTDATGSTTVSMVNAMTPRYCAPEVVMSEHRNTSSDIWSLGVVFLEMIAVLKGRTVEYMYEFLMEHGSQTAYICTNATALSEFVAELRGTGNPADNIALIWVQKMLLVPQAQRPTATSLVASIISAGKEREGNRAFCGICCVLHHDDFSDEVDGLEDNSRS